MSDDGFLLRAFTVRAEGYDRNEVDAFVREARGEIAELRRALEASTAGSADDARLHDPEGAVTRTLAIAQETADRVLHDAQIEADRRRADADESAASTIADADARAAKMMADIEIQTAEVRAQGVAAARSAIQVERDKAVAELGQIRRVRDDIRAEAIELQSILDRYARQSAEAAEVLQGAATGPLLTVDLPSFVADDVALAGVLTDDEFADAAIDVDLGDGVDEPAFIDESDASAESPESGESSDMAGAAETPDDAPVAASEPMWADGDDSAGAPDTGSTDLAFSDGGTDLDEVAEPADGSVIDDVVWGDDGDTAEDDVDDAWFEGDDETLADVISIDGDVAVTDDEPIIELDEVPAPIEPIFADLDAPAPVAEATGDDSGPGSGAFLAEVRAAAGETVGVPAEGEPGDDSDRFLSELRGVTDSVDLDDADIDPDVADRFFDAED